MRALSIAALCALVCSALAACSGSGPAKPFSPDCARRDPGLYCAGERFIECGEGGSLLSREDCGLAGQVCDAAHGCLICHANAFSCEGNALHRCDSTGSSLELIAECEDGLQCSAIGCRDLCADARGRSSYLGCEYHALITLNTSLYEGFSFALAIGNDELIPATVRIYRGAQLIERAEIEAQSMGIVRLPWVEELRRPGGDGTSLVSDGVYRVESDVPVMVQQFNPLAYRMNCAPDVDPYGYCHSYTNDASLLLPDHVAGDEYYVMSRPSFAVKVHQTIIRHSGFFSITSLEDEPIELIIEPRAPTSESLDGVIPALEAGEEYHHTLEKGEVLQIASARFELDSAEDCPGEAREVIRNEGTSMPTPHIYCDAGDPFDLTGTRIRASGKISVVSGHDCTFIPFDRWACDHLEEALFPVHSWGQRVFSPRPFTVNQEPYYLRVLSAEADNEISISELPPFTLGAGEFREFELESDRMITASKPILAAQFLVGQGDVGGKGDPAMALLPPIEQWRSSYAFLRVSNFELGYVSVVARAGAEILIDDMPIGGFEDHPSGYRTARVSIGPGFHEARSSDGSRFGLMLYGYAEYTSYFLPAGLDVEPIYIGPPG